VSDFGEMAMRAATWIVPLTIAIVFHEVAHGLTARHFGDMTAAKAGRLSLNPIRHVDPVGTVGLPLILAVTGAPVFGWAKGVPVRADRLRNPRWHMVLVALAGPASNILLALVGALLIGGLLRAGVVGDGAVIRFLAENLDNFIIINLFLAVFNMLPLPPFDGSRVLAGFLPPALARPFQRLDRYGLMIMLALLVFIPMLFPGQNPVTDIIVPPVEALARLLYGLAGAVGGVG
jgi:Zn-dependent protease